MPIFLEIILTKRKNLGYNKNRLGIGNSAFPNMARQYVIESDTENRGRGKGGSSMWKKGDYVVYGEKGICVVDGTTHLNMRGADSGKLYYVLIPVGERETKIYSPVDNEKVPLRRPMNEQEAMELIGEIPELSELQVTQEKFREDAYKAALRSLDCRQWASMLKTLRRRRQRRLGQGKKVTATDERYFRRAEDYLYSELAMALGKQKSEIEEFISVCIGEREEALE